MKEDERSPNVLCTNHLFRDIGIHFAYVLCMVNDILCNTFVRYESAVVSVIMETSYFAYHLTVKIIFFTNICNHLIVFSILFLCKALSFPDNSVCIMSLLSK